MEIEQDPWGMARCQGEQRDFVQAIKAHMYQVRVVDLELVRVVGIDSAAAGANAAGLDGVAANIHQCRKTSRIS